MKTNKISRKVNNKVLTHSFKIAEYMDTEYTIGCNVSVLDLNNGNVIPSVGMFCNQFGYSDVNPFEIISVSKSGKTLTLRKVDTKISKNFTPNIEVGGFAGHCTNSDEQEWEYFTNKNNPTIKVSLSKKGFGKGRFKVSYLPFKHYDYNF
jgi:hypothetical protein|tara:strand:+ start:247 stop:696 length:450 start_codon:yes stop_codon:yes gene_type:complete